MKILRTIGLVLLLIMVLIGVGGMFLPNYQKIERTTLIKASPEQLFPYVNQLTTFQRWSPWAKIDPEAEYTFSGPEAGVGNKMEWRSSNKNVGVGTQEIIESEAPLRVRTKLILTTKGEPSYAELQLSPNGEQTEVRWTFEASLEKTIDRYFGLFLEDWVGAAYEQGLSNLKTLAEKEQT